MCWQSEYLSQSIGGGGGQIVFFLGWGIREGCGIHTWPKKPKMAHITDYLPVDTSADAPCRINIGNCQDFQSFSITYCLQQYLQLTTIGCTNFICIEQIN